MNEVGSGDRSSRRPPLVTVVMPVRNEVRAIGRSLGAVLEQDYPPERLEILVVDGMSTDGTREAVVRLAAGRPGLRLLDNPQGIVPTGLNAALRETRGDILVRVDGHCEIAPDYVSRCVAHLEAGEADGVGGAIETVGTTRTARAIALAMSSRFGVGNSGFRTQRGTTRLADTVPFPAYTREILQKAGPFDEELVRNQDDEYNFRIRELGGRILLAADVRSRYESRSTFRSLAKQYFQYGWWKVRVIQKHPTQASARHFVPAAFVATLAAAVAASPFLPLAGLAAVGLAGAWGAAATATALGAAREEPALAPRVLAAFAALHLAYGAGFLAGLVRFAGRWGDRSTKVAGAAAPLAEGAKT